MVGYTNFTHREIGIREFDRIPAALRDRFEWVEEQRLYIATVTVEEHAANWDVDDFPLDGRIYDCPIVDNDQGD